METVAGCGYRFIGLIEPARNRVNAPPTPVPRQSRLRSQWPAVVLASVAATALAIWFLGSHRNATSEKATNFIRVTSDTGLTMTPALSEDGKLIAYSSDREAFGVSPPLVQRRSSGGNRIFAGS